MDKLDAMRVFTKVVASGSFAEAGRQLGMTRATASKAVIELEQILSSRLLDRTTRRVRPTEAGLAYYERCLGILADVEETEAQVARLHDEPRGTLKLNAPMSFGALHMGPAIASFMAKYPDLKVELTLNDRFVDPLEEGFDITIRIAILDDSSLIARRIASARRVLAASPAYLAEHGEPATLKDLEHHRCLNYGHSTLLQRWQLTQNGVPVVVPINSVLCANNGDVLRETALSGQGITKLPTFLIGSDLKAGRLKVVLPDFPPTELGIFALYTPNRYLAAKSRLFIDHLVAAFSGTPPWDGL